MKEIGFRKNFIVRGCFLVDFGIGNIIFFVKIYLKSILVVFVILEYLEGVV